MKLLIKILVTVILYPLLVLAEQPIQIIREAGVGYKCLDLTETEVELSQHSTEHVLHSSCSSEQLEHQDRIIRGKAVSVFRYEFSEALAQAYPGADNSQPGATGGNNAPAWNSTPGPSSFIEDVVASYSLANSADTTDNTEDASDADGDGLTFVNVTGCTLPTGITIDNTNDEIDYDGLGTAGTTTGCIFSVDDGIANPVNSFAFSIVINATEGFADNDYGATQISGGNCPDIPFPFSVITDVTTEAEFNTAYSTIAAGEAIRLMDGTFDWDTNVTLDRNGTAANPIYIVYETLHGFNCTGCGRTHLIKGDYHVFAGMTWTNHIGENFQFGEGTGNRVACHVFNGATDSPIKFPTPSQGSPGAKDSVVDNNDIDGVNGISIDINDCGPKTLQAWCDDAQNVRGIHIHHNEIDDSGDEAIKLGLGADAYIEGTVTLFNDNLVEAIVENNLFTNNTGDSEIISVKSNHNIIRNNCFQGSTSVGNIVNRLGHDNLYQGNWCDECDNGIRISGHRNYVIFNYFREEEGNGRGVVVHNENTKAAPNDQLQYHVAKDGAYEFNVFTGTLWMIEDFLKSPANGDITDEPNGNTFQNNAIYSDSLNGNNDAGSYIDAGPSGYTEAEFRAANTWGSNTITTTDLASTTCANAAHFDGPGTAPTFNLPDTIFGGARTISAPSWWD